MTNSEIIQDLKDTLLEFLIDLKENIALKPEEQGDLAIVEFFFNQMTCSNLMQHFIAHVLPWENAIKCRDDKFFINNKRIFGGLPSDRVEYFSQMWKGNRLTQEDRDSIWEYFDTMVEIARQYKKNQ